MKRLKTKTKKSKQVNEGIEGEAKKIKGRRSDRQEKEGWSEGGK